MTLEEYLRDFMSLSEYNSQVEKPHVSRTRDTPLFDFLWEHPEYERHFIITD
jgi:hypothetical protein